MVVSYNQRKYKIMCFSVHAKCISETETNINIQLYLLAFH